jgi:RNA polymerase sigma factor (sigma-70 family)
VSAETKRSSAPAEPRRSVESAVPRRSSAAAKPPAGASGRRLPTDWTTFTDIFRAYAEYIFDYCIGVLGDQAEAAGATTVTFIQAQSLLGRLRDPDRLEAWLYALARRECSSKHPARAETSADAPHHAAYGTQADEAASGFAPADEADAGIAQPDVTAAAGSAMAAEGAAGSADPGSAPDGGPSRRNLADDDTDEFSVIFPDTERRQSARQVLNAFSALPADDRELLTAFSALPPRDREVLDLVYWHGLRPAELAAILGVSTQRAHTVLNAAVRRFRAAAERIQDTAAATGGEPTRSEDKLLAAMPVARMPRTVWRRTVRAVTDPDLRSYREAVVAHAGRLEPNGFPSQAAAPGSRARTLQVAAAVVVPLAGGAALFLYMHGPASAADPAPLAATANASGPSGGSAQAHSAQAKASRKGALPIGALFPRHSALGTPPVTPVPTGGTHRAPRPSPSSVHSPSPAPSSISGPPSSKPSPSHSSSPSPTPTTPSPSPTTASPSPTAGGSPSS